MSNRTESTRRLERELGVLVRRLKRVVSERSREVHPDLQPGSYWMFVHLAEQGPLRASAIAEVLEIDKGAVSRHVQHLLDLGLVDRSPDPDDGRATQLRVSDEGARRLTQVDDQRRRWFEEVLGEWSDTDLEGFAAEMARYNTTVDRARAARDAPITQSAPA